jgi:hypothetical protein
VPTRNLPADYLEAGGTEGARAKGKFERIGGAYPLTSFPMENGSPASTALYAIHPFMLDGVTFVSLADARGEWIVVARYFRGDGFEDLCYLRMADS